ncbi:MAG TPA: FAD-dependent oxidoreductase [Aquabacterium sp.]|nr:FAD-dependent oxidoreductase [Aquabacterium sp.]
MNSLRIGIAGAGLLGRLAAWTLARQGHEVSVFDPAPDAGPRHDGQGAAGFTAAGMLSPVAERETATAALADLGWTSIAHWGRVAQHLEATTPLIHTRGSLLVAHGPDLGTARRVLARLNPSPGSQTPPPRHEPHLLDVQALGQLEPALHSSGGPLHAWLLPGEAHIDTVRTLIALQAQARGVQWHWGQRVIELTAGALTTQAVDHGGHSPPRRHTFDLVWDLRGTGAKEACAVRGVRGELVWLQAPGLGLQRPIRLLHPRHRVYIVPRPDDVVLVGASEVESEDRSPMSLRSAVELMAAAHSVLPALAEARILKLDVNLRPALPDHHPQVQVEPGLIRINGLYRHGWLLAPALLSQALQQAGLRSLLNETTP